ncbi:MAG: hypothetical protein WA268_01730 [Xanthobacteraceae bacterium]
MTIEAARRCPMPARRSSRRLISRYAGITASDLIDEIIAEEFASPDLELAWLDEDEADPKGMEAVLEGRLKLGAVTLNEMRDALRLDPYTNAAAGWPMVLTAAGYVPIRGENAVSAATGKERKSGIISRAIRPPGRSCRAAPEDRPGFSTPGRSCESSRP